MPIKEEDFGKTVYGSSVKAFVLSNSNNVSVEILSLGGIVRCIQVPDKKGTLADVVNGFDDIEGYETKSRYFGALVGRVANRTAKGKFTLDGKDYELVVNNGPNHLHGGTVGYGKKIWDSEVVGDQLKLSLVSPDGDENYPGEVKVTVTYELTNDNELVIDYSATTTQATPINLTNHSYFNLAGHDAANIYDHVVQLSCDKYTPVDDTSIPTGEIANVGGSVFDVRTPTRLGDVLDSVPGGGFDHNFVVNGVEGEKKFVARVTHEPSGRVMEVYTTQPGVQFYTANFLNGTVGKGGATYNKHSSFCLETQNFPDAINKSNFPNSVLRPGAVYKHTTWYKFTTSA